MLRRRPARRVTRCPVVDPRFHPRCEWRTPWAARHRSLISPLAPGPPRQAIGGDCLRLRLLYSACRSPVCRRRVCRRNWLYLRPVQLDFDGSAVSAERFPGSSAGDGRADSRACRTHGPNGLTGCRNQGPGGLGGLAASGPGGLGGLAASGAWRAHGAGGLTGLAGSRGWRSHGAGGLTGLAVHGPGGPRAWRTGRPERLVDRANTSCPDHRPPPW
jgi:hypothetical protein